MKELSLNQLHEKLNYWVSISSEWACQFDHHSHRIVKELRDEIRSRGVKCDVTRGPCKEGQS